MSTDSTVALVTLADARAFIGKKSTENDDDALIEMLIDGVSADFAKEIGRTIIESTDTTLNLDGTGREKIYLPRWPVTSIATVTEDDVALVLGSEYDYLLNLTLGILYRRGAVWSKGRQNIVLATFKAGYAIAAVPKDLKKAALKQIAFEFQEQRTKSWGELSRTSGDGSVSKRDVKKFLEDVQGTLDHYKDIRL